MNRRDTVIVAAVVNVILLGVLFTTAKHSDEKGIEIPISSICSNEAIQHSNLQDKGRGETGSLVKQFMEETPVVSKGIAIEKVETPVESVSKVSEPKKVIEVSAIREKAKDIAVSSISESTLPSAAAEVTKAVEDNKPSGEKFITIVVKKGDFLERIAKANGTTVAAIMRLNDMTSTQLRIGQVIKVPECKQDEKAAVPVTVVSSDDYYIVKEGDSLWSIAMRHHRKVDELLRLNDLDEQKARRLKPGDHLRIR